MSSCKEIEICCQGKRFIAKSMKELDLILRYFRGWGEFDYVLQLPKKDLDAWKRRFLESN